MTTRSSKLIRVLFVAGSLRIGGSQHMMVEILKDLDRRFFDPHLALLECGGECRECVPLDVPLHRLVVHRARMATLPVAALSWKLRPQVVFVFSAQLTTAIVLGRPIMPPGTQILAREGANVTLPLVASAGRRLIYKAAYGLADLVICQSDDMVERLATDFRIPRHKLVRVYNSVDAVAVRTMAHSASPYEGAGPHFVVVSRLVPVKGVDVAIEAMVDVLRFYPSAILTVVGGGPEEFRLRNMVQRFGLEENIRFIGFKLNPFPFIYHADLLVCPSRSEAFSNTILEALALGTPVVATDCPGGVREIARRTKHLVFAKESNPAGLASAIDLTLARSRVWGRKRKIEEECLTEFSPGRNIALYEMTIARAAAMTSMTAPGALETNTG